jgi:hypothetical protein
LGGYPWAMPMASYLIMNDELKREGASVAILTS